MVRAPMNVRKDILTLAQSQQSLKSGAYLRQSLSIDSFTSISVPSFPTRHQHHVSWIQVPAVEFLLSYEDAYLEVIPASILALGCKIAPILSTSECSYLLDLSVFKEISSAITSQQRPALSFDTIFASDPFYRSVPFSHRLEPDPDVASDTYVRFSMLRRDLHGRTFYPSLGNKTCGDVCSSNFWKIYSDNGCDFLHQDGCPMFSVTPSQVYRLYEETGIDCEGPVELRTSWTYNQIKPRVYYARGGSVLRPSLYIQAIVNIIIDSFPETHRINRFSPPDFLPSALDVGYIYDYASFTSSLDQVPDFVDSMARFFQGTVVRLVDIRGGVVEHDLGDLFSEYNRICNEYADFDIAKVLHSDQPEILQHTCGMLGVAGNIFIATLLHGIHLRFISGLGRSRCVGDDAIAYTHEPLGFLDEDSLETLLWRLRSIGEINDDKFGRFEDEEDPNSQAYKYVKRPIRREEGLLVRGILLDIPSPVLLFSCFDDSIHTLRSSVHPCLSVSRQISRFIDTLVSYGITIARYGEDHLSLLSNHLSFLRARMLGMDPSGEHCNIVSGGRPYSFPLIDVWGRVSFVSFILDNMDYQEEYRFPKMGGVLCEDSRELWIGKVFDATFTKRLGFWKSLGYLDEEQLYDYPSLSTVGRDVMSEYVSGLYRYVYRFHVVRDIPVWDHCIADC